MSAPHLRLPGVAIWIVRASRSPAELDRLRSHLSAVELERARGFRSAAIRDRFVACRGALRELVAAYTEQEPAAVRFRRGAHGKPLLVPAGSGSPEFNVSHAEGLSVIALSCGGPVGVDVERVRPFPDLHLLLDRCFSAAERAALLSLPASRLWPAFFRAWTRKEAVVKALGCGLSFPLSSVEVTIDEPDERPRLTGVAEPGGPGWSLRSWHPDDDLVLSLATRTPLRSVAVVQQWPAPFRSECGASATPIRAAVG